MSKEEETRLKALLEKLEGINERGRVKYEALLEESNRVIEESRRARREAEEAFKEAEISHKEAEEAIRESKESRREIERELQEIRAHEELEEARREAEKAHQEALRAQEETERELAWWDSVKNLPQEERVREICKHHQNHEADSSLEKWEALSFFPLGEA